MPLPVVSLDQIISERSFSARSDGKSLTKIHKAPASWNSDARSAKFIMTAEIIDRYGDIVVSKGGDTADFVNNPVALWAHDSRDFPIGMWSDLTTINGASKRVEGVINLSAEGTTPETDTIARLLAQNMVRACSIGFLPKAWESMKDDKDRTVGYRFLQWELLECSVCSIPANPAALVKAAGAGNERLAMQAIELVLDEWARTPEGLIVPRANYERAYEVVRDTKITVHEVRAVDEQDADAEAPVLNPLDIEAAVSRGIAAGFGKILAGDGVVANLKKMLGVTEKEVEKPVVVPVPVKVEDKTVPVDEDGETEEQFQARIAAAKTADEQLADEAEETASRQRAAALTA